jgi:hypothetical protein
MLVFVLILRRYEGKVKSSLPRLCETWDKRPLGIDPDRNWCYHHTTSTIKLFWAQPMASWALVAAYRQGGKYLA